MAKSLIDKVQSKIDDRENRARLAAEARARANKLPGQHFVGGVTVNTGIDHKVWAYFAASRCRISEIKMHATVLEGNKPDVLVAARYGDSFDSQANLKDGPTDIAGEVTLEADGVLEFSVRNVGGAGVVLDNVGITYMVSPA